MLPCWTWTMHLIRMLSLLFMMGTAVRIHHRYTIQSCLSDPGPRVSKYAGEHLHRRLAGEEAYQEKRYEVALKNAFLGTDEDLIASTHPCSIFLLCVVKVQSSPIERYIRCYCGCRTSNTRQNLRSKPCICVIFYYF